MAEEGSPKGYCGRCGNLLQEGDRFCGSCGAKIPPEAQGAGPVGGTPTRVQPPQDVPARNIGKALWIVAAGVLLVLLTGAGVAYAAFGPGAGLLGLSGPQTPEGPPSAAVDEATRESTAAATISPDAPPDPAFDRLLPTLRQKTGARIMLPAELPRPLKNVAVDEGTRGNGYGILFLRQPPEGVEERFARAKVYGTLTASPEAESRSNEHFEATRVEEVELPDGTGATLRYLEPVREKGGTQGPYWEGKFDKGGMIYTLTIISDGVPEGAVVQVLSSMVSVPQGKVSSRSRTTPKSSGNPPPKKSPTSEERKK